MSTPANRTELRQELLRRGVPDYAYDLDSRPLRSDCWVLQEQPEGTWAVYFTERGLNSEFSDFRTEAEACGEMVRRLQHLGYAS